MVQFQWHDTKTVNYEHSASFLALWVLAQLAAKLTIQQRFRKVAAASTASGFLQSPSPSRRPGMGCARSKSKSPSPLSSSHSQKSRVRGQPPQQSRDIFLLANRIMEVTDEDLKRPKTSFGEIKSTNVFKQEHKVTRTKRGQKLDQRGTFRGCSIWC
jgi:hypothetical protein